MECGGLGPRESEPAPPPAYCGACRGAWGQCRCGDHVPSGVSNLGLFAIALSGSPVSKDRAHRVARALGFERSE